MSLDINIEERKPIWIALSNFYLDTELQDSDYKSIAKAFKSSPYTLLEIKRINKYEVFPILQFNLLDIAGEWMGFDEDWLVNGIIDSLCSRNILSNTRIEISYFLWHWMCKKEWKMVESNI